MSVSATLNYLAPWSARNSLYVAPGDQLTTTQYDPRTVPVADGRPHRDDLTLDVAGFELVSHASAVTDFSDSGALDRDYVAESLDLVRRRTGADHAVFLNWMLRNSSPERAGALPPAPDVHVDLHTSAIARRYAEAHVCRSTCTSGAGGSAPARSGEEFRSIQFKKTAWSAPVRRRTRSSDSAT